MLLINTGGQSLDLSVKLTKEDLDSLIFIFQLENHLDSVWWFFIWKDSMELSTDVENMAMSSAYVPTIVFSKDVRSNVYLIYKNGTISLIWETPAKIE